MKQGVLRERNKSATRWKSRTASLVPFFPSVLAHGKPAGVSRQHFLRRSSCQRSFSLLGEFSGSGVRHWYTILYNGVKRDCLRRWHAKRTWLNVHFYSRLLISVGETGRPSRRSDWPEQRKKKTARCLMQCQKQWGYLWRDEKISVDLRQPYIMTLSCKNKRAEKSPMKTKRTIRRLWQSMDNDVYNATLSNVPAGWQHSRIFCYLACSFIELCSE